MNVVDHLAIVDECFTLNALERSSYIVMEEITNGASCLHTGVYVKNKFNLLSSPHPWCDKVACPGVPPGPGQGLSPPQVCGGMNTGTIATQASLGECAGV